MIAYTNINYHSVQLYSKHENYYTTVNYPLSLNKYIALELRNYINCTGIKPNNNEIDKLISRLYFNIKPEHCNKYEFLLVDRYRAVNEQSLARLLDNKGVFIGQARYIINACKRYNLDPIYFISQTAIESRWGSSEFAKGIRIDSIADKSKPIYRNGNLIGYKMIKLKKPVTVYNLFGIGADNSTPSFPNKTMILATTYSYNHGWTSVSSAINGAAQFLSFNYVHNPITIQNTPYSLRYIKSSGDLLWHQYCSDINYPSSIAFLIEKYSYIYKQTDRFNYSVPVFS